MKVGVARGRLSLIRGAELVDVHEASNGALSSHPESLFEVWDDLVALSGALGDSAEYPPLDPAGLDRPLPVPRQAFGIGVNYADHASESVMALPPVPMVFPKFSSCIVGPNDVVRTDSGTIDWEAELVVVIGSDCRDVTVENAWSVVAGLMVGQDISDRAVQFEGGANPQFGLGKSAPGFGPVGPWIVSADEFEANPHLDIRCEVNGVLKQSSNTEQLIFDISTLVSFLSARVQLYAGDIIFTGTPSGVGWGRNPKETLRPGDIITTSIERVGTITTTMGAR